MTVWTVGTNKPGDRPENPPTIHRTRTSAVVALGEEIKNFSDMQTKYPNLDGPQPKGYLEQLRAQMYAAVDSVPEEGSHVFTLRNSQGFDRIFFMSPSDQAYWLLGEDLLSSVDLSYWWLEISSNIFSKKDARAVFFDLEDMDLASRLGVYLQRIKDLGIDCSPQGYGIVLPERAS